LLNLFFNLLTYTDANWKSYNSLCCRLALFFTTACHYVNRFKGNDAYICKILWKSSVHDNGRYTVG